MQHDFTPCYTYDQSENEMIDGIMFPGTNNVDLLCVGASPVTRRVSSTFLKKFLKGEKFHQKLTKFERMSLIADAKKLFVYFICLFIVFAVSDWTKKNLAKICFCSLTNSREKERSFSENSILPMCVLSKFVFLNIFCQNWSWNQHSIS